MRTVEHLRCDAISIWQAGLEAVSSETLVQNAVRVDGDRLQLASDSIELGTVDRIVVVGAGKAGAGMAAGLEQSLGTELMRRKQLVGWVNVPADCVRRLSHIHLHAARPPGVNLPTPEAVAGTQQILELLAALGERDLCIVLLSGGGSALLSAPAPGISLEDKLGVTELLSAGGADIHQLNTVRKQLSSVKGGGLARACGAGRMTTLVISDVPGDPLDLIASGPTVPDRSTAGEALAILERYDARSAGIAPGVFEVLEQRQQSPPPPRCVATTHLIGNNHTAVRAAEQRARELGFVTNSSSAEVPEGRAEEIGSAMADRALEMLAEGGRRCLIEGGEPTVRLIAADLRGRGGRNQQLVLAALERLRERSHDAGGLVLLSGGTDGEDGPTDAAGAWLDKDVLAAAHHGLNPADFLRRNDAYTFFSAVGSLMVTGPTHTNVCDLRVVVTENEHGA